jgi:hypothetical protein
MDNGNANNEDNALLEPLSSEIRFADLASGLVPATVLPMLCKYGMPCDRAQYLTISIFMDLIIAIHKYLWKPRCKATVEWEKANNITAKDK